MQRNKTNKLDRAIKAITDHSKAHSEWQTNLTLLTSIVGTGTITAMKLVAECFVAPCGDRSIDFRLEDDYTWHVKDWLISL